MLLALLTGIVWTVFKVFRWASRPIYKVFKWASRTRALPWLGLIWGVSIVVQVPVKGFHGTGSHQVGEVLGLIFGACLIVVCGRTLRARRAAARAQPS